MFSKFLSSLSLYYSKDDYKDFRKNNIFSFLDHLIFTFYSFWNATIDILCLQESRGLYISIYGKKLI